MSGALIVTGSSRGIGAAVARLAAARGYAVCLSATTSLQEAEAVAQSIREGGGRAIAVGCDVAKEADVVAMFTAADRELGPLAALVNNAGITGPASRVDEIKQATLDHCLAVNVTGSFLCAREAVRRMSTKHGGKGGGIVNVSSRASVLGGAGELVHYAASKGAIDSFTLGLAREVAAEGIRVNAVSPGVIDTSIHAPGRIERVLPAIPMQRVGKPEEIAELTLWLLSGAAAYITGAIVPISGGR